MHVEYSYRPIPCELSVVWQGTHDGEVRVQPERTAETMRWRAQIDLPEPDAIVFVTGRLECEGGFTGRVSDESVAGSEAWRRICDTAKPQRRRSIITYETTDRCGEYVIHLKRGRLPAFEDAEPGENEIAGQVLLDRCTGEVIADARGTGVELVLPYWDVSGGLTPYQRQQYVGIEHPEFCTELYGVDSIVIRGLEVYRGKWSNEQQDLMEQLRAAEQVDAVYLERCPE